MMIVTATMTSVGRVATTLRINPQNTTNILVNVNELKQRQALQCSSIQIILVEEVVNCRIHTEALFSVTPHYRFA